MAINITRFVSNLTFYNLTIYWSNLDSDCLKKIKIGYIIIKYTVVILAYFNEGKTKAFQYIWLDGLHISQHSA